MFFKSSNLVGFTKYPFAPSFVVLFTSSGFSEEVKIKTAVFFNSGCSRIHFRTSVPDIFGMTRSSRIRSGRGY